MNLSKTIPLVAAGMIIGIALVISCSDDSPRKADAAVCDCPIAEPPITSSRIVQIENSITVAANSEDGEGAACPLGAIALGGGCAASVGSVPQIVLEQTIPSDGGWNCRWRNPTNAPIVMRAIVRCLKPGP